MGRRAIGPAVSISEEGPLPPKKFTGLQGDLIPLAGARGQRPRGLSLQVCKDSEQAPSLGYITEMKR